jgi:hypothetical protein
MNTVNKSTRYTPFQLQFGKSPQILLPLTKLTDHSAPDALAHDIVKRMHLLELDVINNLLTAKIEQANQANKRHDMDFPYQVANKVLILTKNHRQEYKSGDT